LTIITKNTHFSGLTPTAVKRPALPSATRYLVFVHNVRFIHIFFYFLKGACPVG